METMSIAAGQLEYAAPPARTLPAVIRSEKENERCSALLEALKPRSLRRRRGGLQNFLQL
jgi:hypothetical protein